MRPSHIVAVDPSLLADADPSGWVPLGTVDGLTYCHVAPHAEPRRFLGGTVTDGALSYTRELAPDEDAPEGATVMVVGERPPLPWGEDYELVYDPSPNPFRWADFALAHPDLAASPGEDEDGHPIPPALTPHAWAGE
jgi:hypothetical protein